jgi:hypothetical protein
MQIRFQVDTGLERTINVPVDVEVIALYLLEQLEKLNKPVEAQERAG